MASSSLALLSLLKPLFSKGVAIAWENRDHLSLFFKTKYGKFKNMDLRFSFSGLYKIQIPESNKYLLVFNRRIANQLQPVGGAYKRFGDDRLFNNWGYRPDNSKNGLDVDEKSSGDLRFMVKGKHTIEVLNWFAEGNEREKDVRREFNEELIDTGILDPVLFRDFNARHIRRFSKNLSWSDFFSCYEILIYDIFEIIPNDLQKKVLVDLAKVECDLTKGYAIVSCDDIEQLRFMQNNKQAARIGHHAKLIINQNF